MRGGSVPRGREGQVGVGGGGATSACRAAQAEVDWQERDSTSFHFQRARSLARWYVRFVCFSFAHTRAHSPFHANGASGPRTKIGNAAVFARRPGPLGAPGPVREFRGNERPRVPKSP